MIPLVTLGRAPVRGFFIPAFAAPRLGQAQAPFRVVVTDVRGHVLKGATVQLLVAGGPAAGILTTDAQGQVVFPSVLNGRPVVRVTYGQIVINAEGPSDQTLVVKLGICAPEPFLTSPEILGSVGGIAIAGAGFYWDISLLRVVGEVLLGAVVFTAIYRHSCSG